MTKFKKPFFIILTIFLTINFYGSGKTNSENVKSSSKKGVRIIYLIRHGQYNIKDKKDADIGKNLIPLGIAQARLVASRLKSLGIRFTALYSSTMSRARETAMEINKDFPYLKLKQFRIIRECLPTTRRADIMKKVSPEEVKKCESNLNIAFKKFFVPSPDKNTRYDIIVCHGNVIRYFVTKVLNVDTAAWLGMSIGNCSLTAVRIKPSGAMKLLFFGDVGHIPVNLQTGLYNKTTPLKIKKSD